MCPMLLTLLAHSRGHGACHAWPLPNLADLWQTISTSQSLGMPGAADVFPGMILFTGQDPDPFWAEAMVSVGESQLLACASAQK